MKQIIDNIKNIFNEYLEEGKEYYKIVKDFFLDYKNIWPKIKKSIQNPLNRKKYATAVLILIFLNIFFIYQLFSFGYYYDGASFPIANTKVGNLYLKDYDYILLVYLQNGDNNYKLVNEIPSSTYKYSGYRCNKGSVLVFDEDTRETSIDLFGKDVCSIYFDLEHESDIILNVMLEDNPDSDTYTVGDTIPIYGYKYDHYECDNNSTLNYDSNLHKVNLSTKSKEKCNIYFKKEPSDVIINLFVENNHNAEDFIERKNIPSDINYSLNTERSYCISKTGERKDANLSYTDGYINLDTDEITECSVYLNKDA